jgi:hypothetical protein
MARQSVTDACDAAVRQIRALEGKLLRDLARMETCP